MLSARTDKVGLSGKQPLNVTTARIQAGLTDQYEYEYEDTNSGCFKQEICVLNTD